MRRWLLRRFYTPQEVLYPGYNCELCVGQDAWAGCHCTYYGAWDPYCPRPPLWARAGRWLFRRWAKAPCDQKLLTW